MATNSYLCAALAASNTTLLTYRLLIDLEVHVTAPSLLLTCTPNAHFALTAVLERAALFNVEVIGRVTTHMDVTSLH